MTLIAPTSTISGFRSIKWLHHFKRRYTRWMIDVGHRVREPTRVSKEGSTMTLCESTFCYTGPQLKRSRLYFPQNEWLPFFRLVQIQSQGDFHDVDATLIPPPRRSRHVRLNIIQYHCGALVQSQFLAITQLSSCIVILWPPSWFLAERVKSPLDDVAVVQLGHVHFEISSINRRNSLVKSIATPRQKKWISHLK